MDEERIVADPSIQASVAAQLPVSGRPRNAKGHKESCTCKICLRLQHAIDSGIPSKAERSAEAKLRKYQRAHAREEEAKARRISLANKGRAQSLVTAAKVESSVASQIALGMKPSLEIAAQIAGVSKGKAREIVSSSSVEESLARNGITIDLLDEVGRAGMTASETRLIIKDGQVVDAIEIPDHHARHKFWRDYNMMIGRLGKEDGQVLPGGLVVIAANAVQNETGHPPECNCDTCRDTWERKTREYLAKHRNMRRVSAIPESIDALDSPEEE